jgi:hypothetical protein
MKARCIQESEIAHSSPAIRELWDWLLMRSTHRGVKIHGRELRRGQLFASINDIRGGLKWFIGYREVKYSRDKIEYGLNWLRKHLMITTTKTTRGLIITISNYDYYQTPQNYEHNTEHGSDSLPTQQPTKTINKNDKNDKKKIAPLSIEKSDYTPANKDEALKLQALCDEVNREYPTLLKMKDPITVDQLRRLVLKHDRAAVFDIFSAMENHPQLLKKYKSANRTTLNWLSNRRN